RLGRRARDHHAVRGAGHPRLARPQARRVALARLAARAGAADARRGEARAHEPPGAGAQAGTVRRVGKALSVRSLSKRYGRVEALNGVDLDVEEGQLVGLLGPNGAGKSTLVKIACGLVRASHGDVRVWGARAGSGPARRALGYLAELFRFPGWMTADELLLLHQRLSGSAGGERERTELLE